MARLKKQISEEPLKETATTLNPSVKEPILSEKVNEVSKQASPSSDMITISKEEWQKVQDSLKMLYDVADKGRVQSYEQQKQGKRISKAKVSIFNGKHIVGWRVDRDINIYHPTTGKQIGEEQKIELTLLDNVGEKSTMNIDGYKQFSDIRYAERVECDIVSRKEDSEGHWIFELKLPDGRLVSLDSRFVN